jgi:hypothetical protein
MIAISGIFDSSSAPTFQFDPASPAPAGLPAMLDGLALPRFRRSAGSRAGTTIAATVIFARDGEARLLWAWTWPTPPPQFQQSSGARHPCRAPDCWWDLAPMRAPVREFR